MRQKLQNNNSAGGQEKMEGIEMTSVQWHKTLSLSLSLSLLTFASDGSYRRYHYPNHNYHQHQQNLPVGSPIELHLGLVVCATCCLQFGPCFFY